MERKNIIIIILACIIIICILIPVLSKTTKKSENVENLECVAEYREMQDEDTGKIYYQIYDKNTGEIIANVDEEYLVEAYLDKPNYAGDEYHQESEDIDLPETIEIEE